MARLLSFKNTNIKEFFFFLILTALLAIISKLSKTYTAVIDIPIEITALPIDKTIEAKNPNHIEASVSLSGFTLLRNRLFKPVFQMSFSKFETVNENTLVYKINEPQVEMDGILRGQFKINAIVPNTISVIVDRYIQKEVPVKSAIKFEYTNGYNAMDNLLITPQMVTITGPASKLESINAIYTVDKTYDNVIKSIKEEVALDTTGLGIRLKKEDFKISISQEVTKFTEGSFTIPIQVVNDDTNQVQIFPKNVNVFFNVSLDAYESINREDFMVTCDFNDIENESNFLSLRLAKFPDKLHNTRLETKQVRFIIVDQ